MVSWVRTLGKHSPTCVYRKFFTMQNNPTKTVKMAAGLKSVSFEDRCAELGLETEHKNIGKENHQTLFTMISEKGGKDSVSGRRKKHCITIRHDRHKERILCY
jgi:hypothetical protein